MKADVKKTDPGFRIVELQAENIKRLVAIDIRPSGDLVEITGRNGQGKTSVLDAIAWAIEGADHIQAVPIRKGWDEARIRLDLGDIIVTRTFALKEGAERATSKVTVESADGARHSSPQQMLDALFGALSMDPMAFQRMKAKDQFDLLKGFVPNYDFAKADQQSKRDAESRTLVGRERDKQRGAQRAITVPPGEHAEPDIAALTKRLADAAQHNADLETRKARRRGAADEIERALDEAEKLRAQAATLEAKAAELQAKLDQAEALPAPIDITATQVKLSAANAPDAPWRLQIQRAAHKKLADEAEEEWGRLAALIEQRKADKIAAIEAARLPVPGLGLEDDVVTLNGLPFDQASDAEQLRASIAIAMAMNTKLRVIRVRDGSLLDDASLKIVEEMAAKHGYQVWLEIVRSDDKMGFYIEDGTVAAVDGKRKKAAVK